MLKPVDLPEAEAGSASPPSSDLADLRFKALLGAEAWTSLPPAVQARFSKCPRANATAIYSGHVTVVRFSRTGWLLAQLLRLIGAPLPLGREAGLPSVVTVSEDPSCQGQYWTRAYARRSGNPQIIQSAKRFCGLTGLEEYIGFGIVMALVPAAENGALVFRGRGYAIAAGKRRLRLPRLLAPGDLMVAHTELDSETFRFTLHLDHAWFGELVHQEAVYREVVA